jgi:hypothetical protein
MTFVDRYGYPIESVMSWGFWRCILRLIIQRLRGNCRVKPSSAS